MELDLTTALARYRSRGVVVDANLLVLYVVGLADEQHVPRFKRTQTFSVDDFYILQLVLEEFRRRVTTPSIVTEVSNLIGQATGELLASCRNCLRDLVTEFDEVRHHSRIVVADELFLQVGFTDCAIRLAADNEYLVMTDDLRLCWQLAQTEVDSLNFNHIRR